MTAKLQRQAQVVETDEKSELDGIARCSRYAFGPNRLHLCGPDMNEELLAYIDAGEIDDGLNNMLAAFKTLFPYLQQIAHSNNIKDPFGDKVVEAYWLGNELLENISAKVVYRHLKDNLGLKKSLPPKQFEYLVDKVGQGAVLHHNFHVFNVWRRTGENRVTHNIESFDKCRISWGKVTEVAGAQITVLRPTLILKGNNLVLDEAKRVKIFRRLESGSLLDDIKAGDFISIHWDMPCEIINRGQLANLIKYTKRSVALANQTI